MIILSKVYYNEKSRYNEGLFELRETLLYQAKISLVQVFSRQISKKK